MRYLILLLLLSSCAKEGTTVTNVTEAKEGFDIVKLFTAEGCTVYRFRDYGNFRYFTNCKGSATWQESCGKNCTRQVEINGGK